MRPAELLQLMAGILFGIAIWSIAAERRMVRRMRIFDATRPQNAVSLGARTPVARFRLWRLVSSGAVVEAGPGMHYLDADAYERYRDSRRKRAIVIMALVLASVVVLGRVLP